MAAVPLETRLRLNDHRRRTFRGDAQGRVAFICECGLDDCAAVVTLTHAEYDRARAEQARIVHAAHGPGSSGVLPPSGITG